MAFESLKGPLAAGVGTVSWGPGRIDVFGVGAGKDLLHWWRQGTQWSGPELLPRLFDGELPAENVGVASWGVNRLDVFAAVKGPNNLQHWWSEDGIHWKGPVPLPPPLQNGQLPAEGVGAVSWGVNRLDVFAAVKGPNNLQHWWSEDGGLLWSIDQLSWNDLNAENVSAVSRAPNSLDVFAVEAGQGRLLHWSWNGVNWSGPQPLGGQMNAEGLGLASPADGRLDVFGVQAGDGQLLHWWQENGSWHGPERLGGQMHPEGVSAVSSAAGILDVFAVGAGSNDLLRWSWNGTLWVGPLSQGGNLPAGDTSAVVVDPGQVHAFAQGVDGSLQHWTANTYPDLALEAAFCLDLLDPLFPSPPLVTLPGGGGPFRTSHPARQTVVQGLRRLLNNLHNDKKSAAFVPKPWVNSICYRNHERLGIWFDAPLEDLDGHTELEQIEILGLLDSNASWTFRLGKETLDRVLELVPRRFTSDGRADPNGPLEILDIALSFQPPDTVGLQIAGVFHPNLLPDQNFHLGYIDKLFIQPGPDSSIRDRRPGCDSQFALNIDNATEIGEFTVSGFLTVLAQTFVETVLHEVLDDVVSQLSSANLFQSPLRGGIGCLAASLFPVVALIPGTVSKLQFLYDDFAVTPDAIIFTGLTPPYVGSRNPIVDIIRQVRLGDSGDYEPGPGTVVVPTDAPIYIGNDGSGQVYISVQANEDLRAPLTVSWVPDSNQAFDVAVQNPNGPATFLTFTVPSETRAELPSSSTLLAHVLVNVTDADGASASKLARVPLVVNAP